MVAPGGARYQVHSMRDCREGWLAAENLCAVRRVVTMAGPVGVSSHAVASVKPKDAGRKAGRESPRERPDSGGRSFLAECPVSASLQWIV